MAFPRRDVSGSSSSESESSRAGELDDDATAEDDGFTFLAGVWPPAPLRLPAAAGAAGALRLAAHRTQATDKRLKRRIVTFACYIHSLMARLIVIAIFSTVAGAGRSASAEDMHAAAGRPGLCAPGARTMQVDSASAGYR